MLRFNIFLFFLFCLAVFLVLQESGIVAFLGIRANILLAFFVFLVAIRRPAWEVFSLLFLFVAFIFLKSSLWAPEALIFSIVISISFFARRLMTGRFLLDFILLTICSTALLFYAFPSFAHMAKDGLSFSGLAFPPYGSLFIEVALNLLTGLVFVLIGSRQNSVKIL